MSSPPFPVARGFLLREVRDRGLGVCLVRWANSFMRDRRAIVGADSQDSEPMEVTTGLNQGSPISPAPPAIFVADIHQAAESQVEDSQGISFVDDITWIVEGTVLNDVVGKLERCAEACLRWADDNAVRFETSKTEAILFSRQRRHGRCDQGVRVGTDGTFFSGSHTAG